MITRNAQRAKIARSAPKFHRNCVPSPGRASADAHPRATGSLARNAIVQLSSRAWSPIPEGGHARYWWGA
jgi:hypothetical protein